MTVIDDAGRPNSERVTLKRGASRASYTSEHIHDVLDAGTIAHVGVITDQGPIVLPMAYGVRGRELLIHGSAANAMMRAGRDHDVCVTVTIVDGLVVARSPFHNSMNYRSVVVRGTATAIVDADDKLAALQVINDHLAPIWETARPPNQAELKQTLVLKLPLTEASAKIREGDPIDDEADLDGPYWSGVVPLRTSWGQPIPAADLRGSPPVPPGVVALAAAGRDTFDPPK